MKDLVGKIVQTKDGFPVRIIAFEPELSRPLIGILQGQVDDWDENGRYSPYPTSIDLVLK